MKTWGRSRGVALLAVFITLMSALVVLPQGANAQGEVIWGVVKTNCGPLESLVPSDVTLSDAHGQLSPRTVTAPDGFFNFDSPTPPPGSYKLVAKPKGFTHFTNETGPFRFEGTAPLQRDLCVDPMPSKGLYLNLTVLDAQPGTVTDEAVAFPETPHGPPFENLTFTYLTTDRTVQVGNRPLVNNSEFGNLRWFNNTGFTPIPGRILTRGVEYQYRADQGFQGKMEILNPTMQQQLANSVFGLNITRGWIHADFYKSATNQSRLAHSMVSNEVFRKNGNVMGSYATTLTLDRNTGNVGIIGNWSFGSDTLTARYDWSGAVPSTVTIRDPAHNNQPISDNITAPNGVAIGQVWAGGSFSVFVQAVGYQPRTVTYNNVVTNTADTVYLAKALTVTVVLTSGGRPVTSSPVGVLINRNQLLDRDLRILRGSANPGSNVVKIPAYPGTWDLMVDANGFAAKRINNLVVASSVTLPPVALSRSPQEWHNTTVLVDRTDWNKITVWRNLTLLPDSEYPGIGFLGLRSLDYQLSFVYGNGDGLADTELGALRNYLLSAGPFHTVTDGFFTVNGKWYRSDNATLTVAVTKWPNGNVTVNASARFNREATQSAIANGKPLYFVNVTTTADRNVTAYQNQSVLVKLPKGYEMTFSTKLGNVATRNFVNVTVDPGVDAQVPNPRINMRVEYSLNGVARAEVTGPAGKVYVKDGTPTIYEAWVANNTWIVFSANRSTDRQGNAVNIKDANFTWKFTNGTLPNDTRWGIWATFNYTENAGLWTVNLTVRQVNPTNVTYRDIKVLVDNKAPTANFTTNKTGTTINPNNLPINEDQPIRFDGVASTDLLYGNVAGKIAEWNWDFDGDGTVDRTGQTAVWNYTKPKSYTMTLFVKDSVGHRSLNQTMAVVVKDVTPPAIDFVMIDQVTNREVSQLTEGKSYWFNASKTTDNSLNKTEDNRNLTFRWQWGDGSPANGTAPPGPLGEFNVSHTYARFGTNYKLNITVWDATNNNATLTRVIIVQANLTAHPDISIIAGTLAKTPTSPEQNGKVVYTLNITNAKGKANATDLKVQLALIDKGKDVNQTFTVAWILAGTRYDLPPTLHPAQNLTVEITWTAPDSVGNKSVKIKVWDGNEPDSWITAANSVSDSIVVREAGWRFWALVGGFVFVVFGLPILYYVVRKVRAGEWQLRRRRGKDEDEEEEEEEEDEEDEDEDRGGKKRL